MTLGVDEHSFVPLSYWLTGVASLSNGATVEGYPAAMPHHPSATWRAERFTVARRCVAT